MRINAINSEFMSYGTTGAVLNTINTKIKPIQFFTAYTKQEDGPKQKLLNLPKMPQRPQKPNRPPFDGQKDLWVPKGWSIAMLAQKYNVSEDEILALNPKIKKADENIAGKKIKLPMREKETMEAYQKQLDEYSKAMKKYSADMKKYEENLKLLEKVQGLRNLGYYYDNLGVEATPDYETGMVILTIKKDVTLGSIRHEFGITSGKLIESNPQIKEKYKPVKHLEIFGNRPHMVNDYDMITVKTDDVLKISPEYINLEKAHKTY